MKNFWKLGGKWGLPLIAILVMLIAIFFLRIVMTTGELYTREGEALGEEITKEMIRNGFCRDKRECNQVLEIYAGHGSRVSFSIYAPKSKAALAMVFTLLIERGIQITNGVPISVTVFPKSRKDYGNIFIDPNPIIRLEIEQ